MERILSLLGLAHKAGRVEIGEEPVGSAARAKKARIILVAGDAAASSVRRAMGFANTGSCLCLVIPATKEQLGKALGRTSCAMAAVTDIGFADAVTGKLAALDPEKVPKRRPAHDREGAAGPGAPAGAAGPREKCAHGEKAPAKAPGKECSDG